MPDYTSIHTGPVIDQGISEGLTAVQPADLATVATTGLYSSLLSIPATFTPSAHNHIATEVTDLTEAVGDAVNGLLAQGANITLTYDDVANTLTVNSAGTDLAYTAATRLLASSTGADITFPLVGTDAGLMTAADKTKLDAITGTNTGNQTSIVGITGTKAQFDTAATDGNFMYIGDAPTAHTHLLAAGATDVTITAANLNALDDAVNTALHFHDADRARANHTGTQLASTVSDFSAAADARITAASINALSDVVITAPSATQVLKFNGTNWINDTDATGGGGVSDGDKGDITVSGSGTVWTVDPAAITLSQMADVATGTVFYRKTAATGAPEVQTLATLKTDLGLTGTNSGDQTSIVGITGTKAQFDTAVSDGNIQFVGDAPTAHTHLLAAGASDVTITAANLNALDDGVNTALHFHDADRARANHTGTQLAATISDFSTAADARIAAASVNALADVAVTTPSVGQVLKWNGSAWINDTDASGGGGAITRIAGNSGGAGADITLQRLTANATANATTTLTTVMTTTGLGIGVWNFQYQVRYQAAATTTGVDFSVNHSGTLTSFLATSIFATSGGAAANGLADQTSSITATMLEGKSQRTKNTSMGASLGVDTANSDMLIIIQGQITVSASGQLELKHASEVAASSQVMAGSNLVLTFIG